MGAIVGRAVLASPVGIGVGAIVGEFVFMANSEPNKAPRAPPANAPPTAAPPRARGGGIPFLKKPFCFNCRFFFLEAEDTPFILPDFLVAASRAFSLFPRCRCLSRLV